MNDRESATFHNSGLSRSSAAEFSIIRKMTNSMLLAAIEALENKKASKTTIEGNRQLRLHDKSLGVKASVSESGRTRKLIEV